MSYSAVYAVTPGVSTVELVEYRNGFGAAPAIWGSLAEKVLRRRRHDWADLLTSEPSPLWELFKDEQLPMFARAVLGMTFDYVFIERQHFKQAALDIRAFLDWAPVPADNVNHWPKIAALLDQHANDEAVPAIGIYHTSAGDNLWRGRFDENDEEQPLEWERYWSLYKELPGSVR
jgi:hypothetical protein